MKIGAHVSIAGGFDRAVERAAQMGANCLQIFASSPQSFKTSQYGKDSLQKFDEALEREKIGPVFFHGIYLINLAADSSRLYELSIESLIFYLNLCEEIPVEGVIFHLGSHKGRGYEAVRQGLISAIKKILDKTKAGKLILENNAGQGGGVGVKFREISDIINCIGSDRLAVCLDSQHALAAGYDVVSREGLKKTLEEFDQEIGLEKLAVVHLNDSKFPLGSLRDRHENIGEGLIGLAGFRNIINHPQLSHLPFIIETPGFDKKGPDKKNLDVLKSLLA